MWFYWVISRFRVWALGTEGCVFAVQGASKEIGGRVGAPKRSGRPEKRFFDRERVDASGGQVEQGLSPGTVRFGGEKRDANPSRHKETLRDRRRAPRRLRHTDTRFAV